MKKLNEKQKEDLASFYNNLALVLLTAGVITPIFTGISNQIEFVIKSIISLTIVGISLQFSLNYLR